MGLVLGERHGSTIREVKDPAYVGQPVVGFVISDSLHGFFAITHRDEIKKFDTEGECIAHIENWWNRRK